MAWWMAAAAAVSAGAQIWGADKGADASEAAARQNAQLARENRNIAIGMNEPNRAVGYGASSDLATLYGYAIPAYVSGQALINGSSSYGGGGGGAGGGNYAGGTGVGGSNRYGSGMIKVDGRAHRGSMDDNFGGSKQMRYGGSIDPITGTVTVDGNPEKSAMLTEYLRTGAGSNGGKKLGRFAREIDKLRASGWTHDPNRAAQQQAANNFNPAAPGSAGNPTGATGAGAATGAATAPAAGNFSRFFTSPDYQWRLDQQNKAVERSAAARGGLFSGRTGTALQEQSGNMASQEFGNYFERLMRMNGMGGAATNNTQQAVQTAGAQIMANNINAADARASSYQQMGSAAGDLMSNWAYLYRRGK